MLSFLRRPGPLWVGAAALVAAVVAAPFVTAQSVPPRPSSAAEGVSVLGEGIVLVQPDVARVTLGVDVFDPSLAKAQADAAGRMDAVIQKLKAAGIPESDIRTFSYSVNPQYDFRENQTPVLRGYQVQNLVDVKSRNISGLGALLDDALAGGATRVNGIRFEAEDMQRLKEQARDQAMQNARAKADQLARAAGVALGRAVYVEENDLGGVTPVKAEAAAMPAAAPAIRASTPIQPGETQIRAVVRVVWAIQ